MDRRPGAGALEAELRARLLESALVEWEGELGQGIARLRRWRSEATWALAGWMDDLAPTRRRILARALAKREHGHERRRVWPEGATGQGGPMSLTAEERELLVEWDTWRSQARKPAGAMLGTNDLRLVSKLVGQQLVGLGGATRAGPLAWQGATPAGGCVVGTRVDVLAPGLVVYHHDLTSPAGRVLRHGLSYLSWLGVAPTTAWVLADVPEAREAGAQVAEWARRFSLAAERVTAGLTGGSRD